VAADLRSFFGTQVFESVIPRNVRLAEAPSHGKPVIFYDIHSKGAESYIQLAKEVIANAEKRSGQGTGRTDSGAGPTAATAAAAAGAGIVTGGIGGSGRDSSSPVASPDDASAGERTGSDTGESTE
jgi:hypothetical protein